MAATGAIYGGKCYASQADAVDAYYSSMVPTQTPGDTSYVLQFVKSPGGWQQQSYSVAPSGAWVLRSTSTAPVPTFPTCDPSAEFLDGVAVGWGIAAAMVAVSALMFMKRAAR